VQILVRRWVVRLLSFSMSKKVEPHRTPPDVFKKGIYARFLPGVAKVAAPPMDKDDGITFRCSHADTVVS
jgi:hypothetical protein